MRILAYIDPGSGSFILQAAAAGLLAAGMSVKVFWRRIRSVFRSQESREES